MRPCPQFTYKRGSLSSRERGDLFASAGLYFIPLPGAGASFQGLAAMGAADAGKAGRSGGADRDSPSRTGPGGAYRAPTGPAGAFDAPSLLGSLRNSRSPRHPYFFGRGRVSDRLLGR